MREIEISSSNPEYGSNHHAPEGKNVIFGGTDHPKHPGEKPFHLFGASCN